MMFLSMGKRKSFFRSHMIRTWVTVAAIAFFLGGGIVLLWVANLRVPDFSSFEERKIAQSTKSARFCKSVSDERAIDSCYTKLAELLPNSLLCEEISAEPRKDACYMNFVNKGDYSVCEKISNDYLRKSCEALKNMG